MIMALVLGAQESGSLNRSAEVIWVILRREGRRLPLVMVLALALATRGVSALCAEQRLNHYLVDGEIQTLGEISMFLYGTHKRATQIAEWNGLSPPYALSIGQKLMLLEPPRVSPEEGRAALLAMWRERFGLPEADDQPLLNLKPLDADELRIVEQSESSAESELRLEDGEALMEKNDLEGARIQFVRARDLEPNQIGAWFLELHVLRRLERRKELAQVLSMLVVRFPQLADIFAISDYRDWVNGSAQPSPSPERSTDP